ncbi:Transposon TX1 uncharacterized 149 kDa protein [Vitis vinifera]|uniref:Transposon TX1 uncharacterized 149 kDa protein n=1 Tax=Vitis vinifera TaxID=29760 RepID=A0A438GT71_VITVI|nr:Transposon TX1 uncharacterized 149 kDa protein [Vitis vinifera]
MTAIRGREVLEWGAVNARGIDEGVVVFWDNKVLELTGMERCKELFLGGARAICGLWDDPWCIGGDFNVTRLPSEHSRGGRLVAAMRGFSKVIDDLPLRDLPLQGGPFTWNGGLNGQTMSRLDRFLVFEDWESQFSGVVQSTLSRPMSDHCPILLDMGRMRRGPMPFHFENMWLKEEGFKDLLKIWWQGLNFKGSSSFIMAAKLKALKKRSRALLVEEVEIRKEAREEYKKWVLMEEISWRQKSRELWFKEVEEREIQGGVVSAFQHLLSDPGVWSPSLDGLVFDRLAGEEVARLEEAFSIKEVVFALFDLNGDKAPGPDGHSLAFWQSSWNLVKKEVMGFFPRISQAWEVEGLYKLLAKVLANRLKKMVGKVVSSSQNAFVKGRQILDIVLIANGPIDSLLKSNECGVMCKLDIEKAYDHLKWDFLLQMLQKMRFGDKWVGWVKWCISTASFLMLVNGTPASFFNSSRRLRQGDPLSPYLFVIGMKALSVLIKRAVSGGFFTSFRVKGRGGERVQLTHLLYADDMLIFYDASKDQLAHLS